MDGCRDGGGTHNGDRDDIDKGIREGSSKSIQMRGAMPFGQTCPQGIPNTDAHTAQLPIEVHVSIVENCLTSSTAAASGYTLKSTSFEYHNTANMQWCIGSGTWDSIAGDSLDILLHALPPA